MTELHRNSDKAEKHELEHTMAAGAAEKMIGQVHNDWGDRSLYHPVWITVKPPLPDLQINGSFDHKDPAQKRGHSELPLC